MIWNSKSHERENKCAPEMIFTIFVPSQMPNLGTRMFDSLNMPCYLGGCWATPPRWHVKSL